MPAFLSHSSPGWPALCLAITLTAVSSSAFAADIIVITDSSHPVKPMGGERIIELDQPARIDRQGDAGDPDSAGLSRRGRRLELGNRQDSGSRG